MTKTKALGRIQNFIGKCMAVDNFYIHIFKLFKRKFGTLLPGNGKSSTLLKSKDLFSIGGPIQQKVE